MNITIASAFRNASRYIPTYAGQMRGLVGALHARGDTPRLLLVHGDSTDNTAELLEALPGAVPCPMHLFECSHGGRNLGSVDTVERWTQIATIWNALLARLDPAADVFLLIESDLVWQPAALVRAVDQLGPDVDGVAGMTWFQGRFYEIWGTKSDGINFTTHPPYHPRWTGHLMRIDSAGSLMCAKAEYARNARFTNTDGIIGWCNGMREAGANLWLDPAIDLYHPPYEELRPL